jgi:excisionase family DNA binding protein
VNLGDATAAMDKRRLETSETGQLASPDTAKLSGFLSASEAATALGVNERTVRRAIIRGEIAATKHGRSFRISPEAVAEFRLRRLSRRRRTPASAALAPPLLRLIKPNLGPAFALPQALTTFLGREREVAAVVAKLDRPEVRLLTLSGPGGVGKTRLALRVADVVAANFADGAAFISLAAVAHADLVLPTVAQALGLRESSRRSWGEQVAAALHGRSLLLVLDNFEHLLPAASLVTDLLAACPRLTILVTSRATLRLSGEHTFPVPPLMLPVPEDVATAATTSRFDAVQLFVARAHAVQPAFVLSDENAGDVADICQQLDGLPLAIELAAARVPILSPRALLTRLDRRLPLLTGGPRDAPRRLQTMRDAIAWSYDLLPPLEQSLFRRLAVFTGGCTLESATAVAESETDVLDGISSLVASSLLRQEIGADGEPHFTMLETIREFGLERLEEEGELPGVQAALAAYFVAFGERQHPNRVQRHERVDTRIERVEVEQANVRSALTHMATRDDADGVLRLAGALAVYWHLRGHLHEGRHWLEWALDRTAELATAPRGRALAGLSLILWAQGHYARATELADAGLAIGEQLGADEIAANSLHVLGLIAFVQGQLHRAGPIMERACRLWRELGARVEEGWALDVLGRIADGLGDSDLATSRAEESLAIFRAVGHASGAATALDRLAKLARDRGDDRFAVMAHREGLQLWSDVGDRWPIVQALAGLSAIASAHGQSSSAAVLLGVIDTLVHEVGAPIFPSARVNYDRAARAALADLGEGRFVARRADGRRLRRDDVVSVAAAVAVPAGRGLSGLPFATGDAGLLTKRQHHVLRLVAEGRTDREIADLLFLSPRTVNAHVARILERLDVRTRREAALRGRELGLLAAGDQPYRYT